MTIGWIITFVIIIYIFLHILVAIFLLTNDYNLMIYPNELFYETNLNWFGVTCIYILYCILCPVYAFLTLLYWIATK